MPNQSEHKASGFSALGEPSNEALILKLNEAVESHARMRREADRLREQLNNLATALLRDYADIIEYEPALRTVDDIESVALAKAALAQVGTEGAKIRESLPRTFQL